VWRGVLGRCAFKDKGARNGRGRRKGEARKAEKEAGGRVILQKRGPWTSSGAYNRAVRKEEKKKT